MGGGAPCESSRWKAENLGAPVNSAANELDPGLSADGFRLHFSSNRAETRAEESKEAGGARVQSAHSEERRYGLWQSVSREVYFEGRPLSAELLEIWGRSWPWLALLAATLLLAWLLAKLIRSEVWRKRFARLSLLAQCLILSCMIHALIATGLAAWEVGQGVIAMVNGGEGGGTQVILSSSSGLGDAGGMAMGQITSSAIEIPAGMGGDAIPESSTAEIARRMSAEIPQQMASVLPDAMLMPLMSVVETKDAKVREAGAAATEIVEPGASGGDPDAKLPAIERGETVAERAAREVEVAGEVSRTAPTLDAMIDGTAEESAPLRAMTIENRPVVVDVREAAGENMDATRVRAVPEEQGGEIGAVPAMQGKVATDERTAPDAAGAAVNGSLARTGPQAMPGTTVAIDATRPDVARMEGLDAAAAGVPSVGDARVMEPAQARGAMRAITRDAGRQQMEMAVPASIAGSAVREEAARSASSGGVNAGSSPGSGVDIGDDAARVRRADVTAPRMEIGANGGRASGAEIAGKDAAVVGTQPRVQSAEQIGGKNGGADARLPSVVGTRAASKDEAKVGQIAGGGTELKGIGAGRSDLPAVSVAAPGIATGSGPVLGKLETGAIDRGRGAVAGVKEASVQPGNGRSSASAVPRMERSGMNDKFGIRLPEIPTEQVDPLETFAQRAPEVRGQLLERMGGSRETEAAVGRALAWMARHQAADGRWSSRGFDDGCGACDEPATVDADVAMTGMALLCYLGAGHTHMDEGPYREHVRKGIEWLLARQNDGGDMRGRETMYGQTVATVALCEALSMTGDERLKGPAKRAADFVVGIAARPRAAGTEVRPEDTSVIGWLVMTVESARRAGIPVPPSVYVSAAKWLDQVAAPGQAGVYSYRAGGAPSIAMTAEAMFVQQILGRKREEPRMRESAAYLLREPPTWRDGAPTHSWYYATLALFEQQGDAWERWNDSMRKELLGGQRRDGGADGSWDPQDEWSRLGGRMYQTAVCTLCLEVYYRYAPSEGDERVTSLREEGERSGTSGATGSPGRP
jgi:hypothetical protein